MINLVNLTLAYDGVLALNGVSLTVNDGSLLGLMGPAGSGKTSLCRVIAGLTRPTSGVAFVAGTDLVTSSQANVQKLQARIGMQFQNDALLEHMSVLRNIEYPLRRLTQLGENEILFRAMEQLAMVGLSDFEHRIPSSLSGGQRRRVALARACITAPDLLICDDPTAGLDPVTSRRILDGIAGIRYRQKNTVIIVSADVQGLMSICDQIAVMWDGEIIRVDTPTALQQDKNPKVCRFIEDALLPKEFLR